jgi:protein MpaA
VSEDSEDKRQRILEQLELAHRTIVSFQVSQLQNHLGPPPNTDHPVNLVKVKLLWKLVPLRGHTKFKLNSKKVAIFGGPILVLLLLFFIYSVLLPRNLDYNFASSNNCASSPLLFPSLFARTTSGTFELKRTDTKLLGVSVYSGHVCAKPIAGPKAALSYKTSEWLNVFGFKISKKINVGTGDYVLADAPKLGESAIPIEKPLVIKLNRPDQTFEYVVSANGQSAQCLKTSRQISCNLSALKLAYGSNYNVTLERDFDDHISGTLLSKNIQTITATAISNTSIAAGATVFDKPNQVVLTTSKSLNSLSGLTLSYKNSSGTMTTVPIKYSFKGNQITINWTTTLPRQTTFDVHLTNVQAADYSTLEQPYDLNFITSGGPTVSGDNIPSYGLDPTQSLNVSFNQPLDTNQNITSEIALLVNGQPASATVTLNGNQAITVTPNSAYPVCATVKLQFSPNIESNYDVSGNSSWSYSSRSHCYTTFSIGTSVQGRPLTAYEFGSNLDSNMVLFIANMEGNEQNSANLLTQWIPDIDANPGKIPSGRTVVVIPHINPDGYVADTRLNAAGIDLNRNFPANNWSEQVTEPLGNGVVTNDGGPYPLSAPESQALASFYEAHKPMLTLTMHSHGGIVEANDAGNSDALGATYASLADYKAIPTYKIGNFFDYTTTGAFEDWANNKLNLPVLEVELESPTNDEYSRNLPALWEMVKNP